MTLKAIQITETFKTAGDANACLHACAKQVGYLGGRVLAPAPSKPGWRVQAFVTDDTDGHGWLPDGMRRVVIPEMLAKTLGIKS